MNLEKLVHLLVLLKSDLPAVASSGIMSLGSTTDEWRFDSRWVQQRFLISQLPRPLLGPTQLHIQRVTRPLCLQIEPPGCEANHLHLGPRLRMCGVVLPVPHVFMVCTGASLSLSLADAMLTVRHFSLHGNNESASIGQKQAPISIHVV